MWSPLTHSTNLNSPVPIGFFSKASGPTCWKYLAGMICAPQNASRCGSSTSGAFILKVAVRSSGVSIEAIVQASRALRAVRLTNADEPAQPFAAYRAEP